MSNLLVGRVRGLQAQEVVRVRLGAPVNAVATVRLAAGETTHRLESADLMSAVLLFCRNMRIPLSSRSHKKLSLIGDKLALTTTLNLGTAPPLVVEDAVMHGLAGPDLAMLHTV